MNCAISLSEVPGFGQKTMAVLNHHNITTVEDFLNLNVEMAKEIGISNFSKLFNNATKFGNSGKHKQPANLKDVPELKKKRNNLKWKVNEVEVDDALYERCVTSDHSWYGIDISFPMLSLVSPNAGKQEYTCVKTKGVIQQLAVEGLRVSFLISFQKNQKNYISSITLTPTTIAHFNKHLPILSVGSESQSQVDQAQRFFLRQSIWETNVVITNSTNKNRSV